MAAGGSIAALVHLLGITPGGRAAMELSGIRCLISHSLVVATTVGTPRGSATGRRGARGVLYPPVGPRGAMTRPTPIALHSPIQALGVETSYTAFLANILLKSYILHTVALHLFFCWAKKQKKLWKYYHGTFMTR